MESQRSILVIGLMLVSFLLWNQWQIQYGPQPVATVEQQVNEDSVPVASNNTVATNDEVPESTQQSVIDNNPDLKRNLITVKTDTLDIVIDTLGGDVISTKLIKYPLELEGAEPITILSSDNGFTYIAQSGLIGQAGPDSNAEGRPLYASQFQEYVLEGEQLVVPLTFVSVDGIQYTKSFIFTRGKHSVEVKYNVVNTTSSSITFQQYAQLKQQTGKSGGSMFMPTYRGGAYSTVDDIYEKYDFDEFAEERLNIATEAGWVSMLEHYFISAWIPPQTDVNTIYSRLINQNQAVIGYTGTNINVVPGETGTVSSYLYVGPKIQSDLEQLARGLDLTVDYGPLWMVSKGLFWLLGMIQAFVINWGAAIIIITIIVKGVMYPLTKAQYVSMAKMRALAPKIQALKDRYGDDRQKMSQGMMDLYKKEKTNPMGGCFPLLLQMPIFLALYWVLLESVELRHADFIFWINDLSVMDPFFVLPILTGASMYILQKLNPVTIQDPMQQKIMQFMPVVMSVFFIWFPAGLVLYWLISNVITIVQAKLIYASMEKKGIKVN